MQTDIVRQVVLDTETTGMSKGKSYCEGHRIIEIGAVEMINRRLTNRYFHVYLNPNRNIDLEAFNIHGINEDFLQDKPTFCKIANDFLNFIVGSELIMHNAPFDVSFLDHEFFMFNRNIKPLSSLCKIIDTLPLARKLFPGKKNSLDALCERYYIDNTVRDFHNALVDAKLLANIFLLMTGGQILMPFMEKDIGISCDNNNTIDKKIVSYGASRIVDPFSVRVLYANSDENIAHNLYLDMIKKNNHGVCVWYDKYTIF